MTNLHRLKTLLIAGIVAILALSPAYAKEKFKVITTFTVIADMAKNVAGDAAEVSSITKPGAEIHEYQPTPGDIKRAQGAQLILANGLNLERWFARFYQHLPACRKSSSPPVSNRWALPKARITVNRTRTPGCRQKTR